jgi:hypothetical protein
MVTWVGLAILSYNCQGYHRRQTVVSSPIPKTISSWASNAIKLGVIHMLQSWNNGSGLRNLDRWGKGQLFCHYVESLWIWPWSRTSG